MIYIDDCLRAAVEFMELPSEALTQRTYNVTAMSFSPEELVEEMKRYYPNMRIDYKPDEKKQSIGELLEEREREQFCPSKISSYILYWSPHTVHYTVHSIVHSMRLFCLITKLMKGINAHTYTHCDLYLYFNYLS